MLSLMTPSVVSSTGSAVLPRVFSRSYPGRGVVMSTTWNFARSPNPLRESRISNRWEKGQTGIWWTIGVSRTPSFTVCVKASLAKLPRSRSLGGG